MAARQVLQGIESRTPEDESDSDRDRNRGRQRRWRQRARRQQTAVDGVEAVEFNIPGEGSGGCPSTRGQRLSEARRGRELDHVTGQMVHRPAPFQARPLTPWRR